MRSNRTSIRRSAVLNTTGYDFDLAITNSIPADKEGEAPARTRPTNQTPPLSGDTLLAGLLDAAMRQLAGATSVFTDDVVVVDSTPVECARSRATVKRSALAGWAEYGYCASHSRFFWGLRLHLVATLHGLPVASALTGAKADERHVLLGLLNTNPALSLVAGRTIIADKNYYARQFEQHLAATGFTLLRKPRAGEAPRTGGQLFKPLRQTIESVFHTLKDPLTLERHRGRTPAGVITRVLTRLLALTAVIWHNDHAGAPTRRSLLAYDH